MIYFDGVHMAADTLDELHAEATRIGLDRKWFQCHATHPHYDVWGGPAKRLVVNCKPRELVMRSRAMLTTTGAVHAAAPRRD